MALFKDTDIKMNWWKKNMTVYIAYLGSQTQIGWKPLPRQSRETLVFDDLKQTNKKKTQMFY